MVAALLNSLMSLADGAAATPAAAATGPTGIAGFFKDNWIIPFMAIYAVIWFGYLAPKRKEQKLQADWVKNIKKGDEVVTTGGLIGKVSGFTDQTVTLEVQEKVRLKVLRSHIVGKAPSPTAQVTPAAETQPAK